MKSTYQAQRVALFARTTTATLIQSVTILEALLVAGKASQEEIMARAWTIDELEQRRPVVWPVLLMSLSAFVGIWGGWVELGKLTGFGMVNLLPGIAPDGGWATLNTAITLPLGVEAYAAYALWVWLSGRAPRGARRFARASAIGSLLLGMAGQASYHLLASAGVTVAPWWLTALVSALPVAVLGMGAALAHMQFADDDES